MAITAQELRVGNYIERYNKVTGVKDVVKVDGNTPFSAFETMNTLQFNPIPLTEEWLLKFGFESYDGEIYNPDCEYSEQFLYQLKSGISYREFLCFPSKGWIVKIGDYNDDLEIKFVHELQNIYFALIGEELTIKQLSKL